MNKASLSSRLSILAVVSSLLALVWIHPSSSGAASKPAPATEQKSEGAGHLVIVRSANLGAAVVGISVDGKQVAKLNFNGKYDAPISAGPHVLSAIPIPNSEHATANDRKITVEAGKTYTFTAKRDDVRIVLK